MTSPNIYPAPAKINLFLHVTGRRDDGYHLLQTAFTFIDLADNIQISLRDDGEIHLENPIPGVEASQDLTVRAAKLLQAHTGCPLGANLKVDKRIPMGGGLGGGSSDAATVLIALNHLWQTNLDRDTLQMLGLQLGADVPVFIFGHSAFAEGVGEKLTRIDVPAQWYLLATPSVQVPTAKIFCDPLLTRDTTPIKMPVFRKNCETPLRNDLQAVACRLYPEVQFAVDCLSQFGEAIMTGSGACVFVGFDTKQEAEAAKAKLPTELPACVVCGYNTHPLHSIGQAA
ncbi:4-(cytidine 5'-diphospho)-2-C-methyl-D-erythritol kinase [Leeia oryzae]|uniref:4-(cytidine 5'-diphospho)-2-C-methyl-D-erythritol kinase n=1 Tax=Leeia oryzae TaxID=356662 RepID=UPI000367072A|nr:4-(cytidine 5'-diphospho)-2-C-methyl-D-erythritol kinase [Leeia oryzae]